MFDRIDNGVNVYTVVYMNGGQRTFRSDEFLMDSFRGSGYVTFTRLDRKKQYFIPYSTIEEIIVNEID